MGPIPANCTGIELIDETKPFCSINCRWVDRRGESKEKPVKMPPKRKMKDKINKPKSICLVLEEDHFNYIKTQAFHASMSEQEHISPNQLIREALQKAFPLPTQMDMFGKKNVK